MNEKAEAEAAVSRSAADRDEAFRVKCSCDEALKARSRELAIARRELAAARLSGSARIAAMRDAGTARATSGRFALRMPNAALAQP